MNQDDFTLFKTFQWLSITQREESTLHPHLPSSPYSLASPDWPSLLLLVHVDFILALRLSSSWPRTCVTCLFFQVPTQIWLPVVAVPRHPIWSISHPYFRHTLTLCSVLFFVMELSSDVPFYNWIVFPAEVQALWGRSLVYFLFISYFLRVLDTCLIINIVMNKFFLLTSKMDFKWLFIRSLAIKQLTLIWFLSPCFFYFTILCWILLEWHVSFKKWWVLNKIEDGCMCRHMLALSLCFVMVSVAQKTIQTTFWR